MSEELFEQKLSVSIRSIFKIIPTQRAHEKKNQLNPLRYRNELIAMIRKIFWIHTENVSFSFEPSSLKSNEFRVRMIDSNVARKCTERRNLLCRDEETKRSREIFLSVIRGGACAVNVHWLIPFEVRSKRKILYAMEEKNYFLKQNYNNQ